MASTLLAELPPQFNAISERAQELYRKLGEAGLMKRPGPERWSPAECLAHLNLTSKRFFPIWESSFASLRNSRSFSDGPYKADWLGRLLAWSLEPPPRSRFKTPAAFQPVITGEASEVLPEFLACQAKLLQLLARGQGLALDRIKIASPFNQKLHYNLWASFCVTAAHQRRHLWQAEHAV